MTPTSTQYILRDEGIFRQLVYEAPILNTEQIITSLISKGFIGVPFRLPALHASYSDATYLLFNKANKDTKTIVVSELPWLLFPGALLIPKDGGYVFEPRHDHVDGIVQKEPLKWNHPSLKLFLMTFHKNLGIVDNYLFAINSNGKTIKMPYPNIFDDMRVCMGNTFNKNITNPIEAAKKSLIHFFEEPMNRDLFKRDKSDQFFQFNGDGEPVVNSEEVLARNSLPATNDLTIEFVRFYHELNS